MADDVWMYEPKAFRFHVGGDFFSVWYLDACISVAKRHPRVKFFAFTKQFAVVRHWLQVSESKMPKNFSLILSAWWKFDPPKDLMKRFPVAWLEYPTGLVPDYGRKMDSCKGKCDECGKCFNRKVKDGDIVFQYH